MSAPKTGRFVWHDHVSKDPKTALKFYTQLFGWKGLSHAPEYTMIEANGQTLGGFIDLAEPSVPAHWVAYATVSDVDATADKAKSLGGKILIAPRDIPNVGRFASIADPRGAVLSPIALAKAPEEPEGMPAVGTFCWNELMTDDVAGAEMFYAALYGWTTKNTDMGPAGTYTIFERGDKQAGGMMKKPEMAKDVPSHWLHYVAVANVDTAVAKAEGLGAKVLVKPQDIPNVGRFAVLQDPVGAVLAVFRGA
jgi:predicted enzyme related to lactoylglutathione lyase